MKQRYNLPDAKAVTFHGNLQAFLNNIAERLRRLEPTATTVRKQIYKATAVTNSGTATTLTNAVDGDFETKGTSSRSGNVNTATSLTISGFGDSTIDTGRRYTNQKLSIKAFATILNESDATDTATASLQLSIDNGTTWEITLQTISATGAAATATFKYDNRFTPYRIPDGVEPKNLRIRLVHTPHGVAAGNDGSVTLDFYESEWTGEY